MKKTIYFLILFCFCSFVYAQPPFNTDIVEPAQVGLQISYPQFQYYSDGGNDLCLHFHVHNSTNWLMTNSTVSCIIHIYDYKGCHIVEDELSFSTNDVDFEYQLYSNNVTEGENYHYLVYCNSTTGEAGFLGASFGITSDGLAPEYDGSASIGILIIFMVMSFFLIYVSTFKNRFSVNEILDYVLKKCCLLLGLYFFTILTTMSLTISDKYSLGLNKLIITIMFIVNWSIYLILLILVLVTGLKVLNMWSKNKYNERYGTDDEQ